MMPIAADMAAIAAYVPKTLKERIEGLKKYDRRATTSWVIEEALMAQLDKIEEEIKQKHKRYPQRTAPKSH